MTLSLNAKTPRRPDFAFPKTVAADSRKQLDEALHKGRDVEALRAVINLTIAENIIDSDSMPRCLNELEALAEKFDRPAPRAILDLLRATIYTEYYRSQRWTINERPDAPTTSEDYTEWNATQFEARVAELLNAAMADPEALFKAPLRDYDILLAIPAKEANLEYTYYPSLLDFIGGQAIDLIEDFNSPSSRELASEYRQTLLRLNADRPAPLVVQRIQALENDNPDQEQLRRGLIEIYESTLPSAFAGEALIALGSATNDSDIDQCRQTKELIDGFMERFPTFSRSSELKNIIAEITRRRATISSRSVIIPGTELTVSAEVYNTPSLTITLYRLPAGYVDKDEDNYYTLKDGIIPPALRTIASHTLSFSSSAPFRDNGEVTFQIPEPGLYIVVPSAPGLVPTTSARIVRATSLGLGAISLGRQTDLFVVNPLSGAPVDDVEIYKTEKKQTGVIGRTDRDGFLSGHSKFDYSLFRPVKGEDRYAPLTHIWDRSERLDTTRRYDIDILTDLPLYHPGDTVGFTAIVYSVKDRTSRVELGLTLNATLYDANHQEVDTLSLRSGSFGRVEGSFAIPNDGRLNGSYSIRIGSPAVGYENIRFMVSDYKLPTFAVEADEAATGVPEPGAVTLRGRVMSYTGMPVADARVAIKVQAMTFWRYWMGETRSFNPLELTATTDASGRWELVIPADSLAAFGGNRWFTADITATSPAGETQATNTTFALGSPIRISSAIGSVVKVDGSSLRLPVKAINTAGETVDSVRFDYELRADKTDDLILSGSFMSDSAVVDWSTVEPGMYTLSLTIEGDSMKVGPMAIYNPAINRSPSSEVIWTPSGSVNFTEDSAEILLGTSAQRAETWVLFTLYDYEQVIERRWLNLPPGLHHIAIDKRYADRENLRAGFAATADYSTREINISILPAVDPRRLTLRAEAMRTTVMANTTERWTFSVVDATGKGVESALLLDMYNKALDALSPHSWSIPNPHFGSLSLRYNDPSTGRYVMTSLNSFSNGRWQGSSFYLPSFQLYGQSLSPQTFRRGRALYNMSLGAKMMSKDVIDEMAVEECEMAAPTAAFAASADMAENVAEHAEVVEVATDTGSGPAPDVQSSEPFAYRDAETPLALFRPMLTTAPDGTLQFSVTFPNANATWMLQALAFTEDLRAASLRREIVASKPVMIKPNMPRFLREGDKATILSSVMNATDEEQTVDVRIEHFNPSDDSIIKSSTTTLTLAPQAAEIVPFEIEAVPGDILLGLRAKVSTKTFADGEQVIIPILEASTPVIDSEPFYMSGSTADATVTLPASPAAEESVTTIEFCENPVWYVVTALPGLDAADPETSPQAAGVIFSAAIARHLLNTFPAIREAIKEWTAAGSTSEALTSMLERNPDLKTYILQATPWMNSASADNERMARLALLLDDANINRSINKAVTLLRDLQTSSGGWKWIAAFDEPSEWATRSVLSVFASLKNLGIPTDDEELTSMISRAIPYIDAEAVKTQRRYPKSRQIAFTALRSVFTEPKPDAAVESVMSRATQDVVAHWKDYSIQEKPQAAMLLYRRGYKTVAGEILESMRQFMTFTPDKGSFFPTLQNYAYGYISFTADALLAFATIEPGASEVEGLRQWLIVQKQATDWGNSPAASEVVAAILMATPGGPSNAAGATVVVNGHPQAIPATDSRLGYFRISPDIPATEAVTLNISKQGDTPAWGAVMRRSVMPLRDVEASGNADLSIEKSIVAGDTLTVGSTITVRLVIRVGRNLNYVAISDDRAACFEPVEQLPSVQYSEGVLFYLEPRDARTSIFVTTMPKGTYVLSYDVRVNNAGAFASGIATAASQYAPEITARSAGSTLTVNNDERQ